MAKFFLFPKFISHISPFCLLIYSLFCLFVCLCVCLFLFVRLSVCQFLFVRLLCGRRQKLIRDWRSCLHQKLLTREDCQQLFWAQWKFILSLGFPTTILCTMTIHMIFQNYNSCEISFWISTRTFGLNFFYFAE